MGYSREQAAKYSPTVKTTDIRATTVLDSMINTTQVIELNIIASQITIQTHGNMSFAGTYTVSLNGIDFDTGGSLPSSGGLSSYNSNLVSVVKITCSAGSGQVWVAAVP
jgi:hypothetical protein